MERVKSRLGWALAGALAIVLVLALARATVAGPLDPPGPVSSTMRTIDELLPSWGKTLSSSGGCNAQRFTCVMSNAAVLDHETGLVWQRVPGTTGMDYPTADDTCRQSKLGGRYGWRLPTISELLALDDDTTADSLPPGHPFTNTPDTYLWSTTSDARDPQFIQTMTFLNGGAAVSVTGRPRLGSAPGDLARAWCVRGTGDPGVASSAAEQPAWARQLDATGGCHSARFECVLPTIANSTGEAVLDRETGLVWQRTPLSTVSNYNAVFNNCLTASTGDRHGWRLPTFYEAETLFDPAHPSPTVGLPLGHPFNIAPALVGASFASVSTFLSAGSYIPFDLSGSSFGNFNKLGASLVAAWCVRGPGGEYAY
jgi:hypothetical protein